MPAIRLPTASRSITGNQPILSASCASIVAILAQFARSKLSAKPAAAMSEISTSPLQRRWLALALSSNPEQCRRARLHVPGDDQGRAVLLLPRAVSVGKGTLITSQISQLAIGLGIGSAAPIPRRWQTDRPPRGAHRSASTPRVCPRMVSAISSPGRRPRSSPDCLRNRRLSLACQPAGDHERTGKDFPSLVKGRWLPLRTAAPRERLVTTSVRRVEQASCANARTRNRTTQ